MTTEEAKQILQLYRPDTADSADPEFAQALQLCEHDAELKAWFGNHCALYVAIRSKFKRIAVPEGFQEQIISERRVHHQTPLWQKAVLVAGAVAAVVVLLFGLREWYTPPERHDFAAYRSTMGSSAARAYTMDLLTNDLDQIRIYLAQRKAIADYAIPENLKANAKATGCVATSWQGHSVSMICFLTGRPLGPNQQSDLWLFISESKVAKDAPVAAVPKIDHTNGLVTGSWTVGDRTYLLAMEGSDKQLLAKYLPANATL